ncbi:MAG: hypothetical protein QOF48_842 [Verrucomicrobiota bacterium]|jgi:hypothetical protein
MKTRAPTFAFTSGASIALVLGFSLAHAGAALSPVPEQTSREAVRVEILEGFPDQASWAFTNESSRVTETYGEPAFGFPAMPAKYSARGVKADRGFPFLFRASAPVTLPKGDLRLLLRARTGSRLFVDGKLLLSTRFPNLNADGHEEVPELPVAAAADIRYLQPGQFESLTRFTSDGLPHQFLLEALIGTKGRRPELGELSVSFSTGDGESFRLVSPQRDVLLTESGWAAFEQERRAFWRAQDKERRAILSAGEAKYWNQRHESARQFLTSEVTRTRAGGSAKTAPPAASSPTIDDFINARLRAAGATVAPLTDDAMFLRRVSLDTIGVIPTIDALEGFLRDTGSDRRARAIDRLLADGGWADHWVSYWQDVLAENPGILKPMLNNTGPFRWWLHEVFTDNKPMDRFATELILMEGSPYYGGPAGFGMASDNDVPMAQKAQILAQAFMGMQMQCARCHDAPYHNFKQEQLFSLAAMLRREPQLVPLTSSIPTNSNIVIGRIVKVTLKPGSKVAPQWPFPNTMTDAVPDGVLRDPQDPRERLAALMTDPRNDRFARVLVNRIWKRYLGWGIVEPVDDWETAKPSHPELLDFLARELVVHDYDLKHVARLILNSQTYQRAALPAGSEEKPFDQRLFAAPARRRLSAEQLVDSLFATVNKPFHSEEMNMDVDGRRPVKDFNNLGSPGRAWEFASLSNERDRPALSMPHAQSIVDALCTFGWRESRQSPQTIRDHDANVLQPAALANGIMANGRIARLSDDSGITALCLEDRPLPELVRRLFLGILSRPPSGAESRTFAALLGEGYADRRLKPSGSSAHQSRPARAVSWSNHLNPEATQIKQEQERAAREGDPPTDRLRASWRERAEDAVWALINSPEFVFVP